MATMTKGEVQGEMLHLLTLAEMAARTAREAMVIARERAMVAQSNRLAVVGPGGIVNGANVSQQAAADAAHLNNTANAELQSLFTTVQRMGQLLDAIKAAASGAVAGTMPGPADSAAGPHG